MGKKSLDRISGPLTIISEDVLFLQYKLLVLNESQEFRYKRNSHIILAIKLNCGEGRHQGEGLMLNWETIISLTSLNCNCLPSDFVNSFRRGSYNRTLKSKCFSSDII